MGKISQKLIIGAEGVYSGLESTYHLNQTESKLTHTLFFQPLNLNNTHHSIAKKNQWKNKVVMATACQQRLLKDFKQILQQDSKQVEYLYILKNQRKFPNSQIPWSVILIGFSNVYHSAINSLGKWEVTLV